MIGRALGLILVVCATGWAQELRNPSSERRLSPSKQLDRSGQLKELYKAEKHQKPVKASAASDRVIIVVGGMDPSRTGFSAMEIEKGVLPANSQLGGRLGDRPEGTPGLKAFSNNSLELATALGGSEQGYHYVPWSGNLLHSNDHANATEALKEFIVNQLEKGKTVSVLAHSDGGSIAYNALTDLANGPPIKLSAGAHVDKLVTIGTLLSDVTGRRGEIASINVPTILKGGWLNVASATDKLSAAIDRPGVVDAAIATPYEDNFFSLKEHFQYYKDQDVREALQAVLTSDERVHGLRLPKALIPVSEQRTANLMQRREIELREIARSELRRDSIIEGRENTWNVTLKAADYQLAKSVTDAHGNRVRIEAYVLRPAPNQVQQLVLNAREHRFDYGYILSTFFRSISGLEEARAVTRNTFNSPTMPANYLTQYDLVATNTVDRIRQTANLGAPAALNFGASTRFFPSTIDMTLRLTGPGYDTIKQTVATTHNGTQFTYRVQYPNAGGVLTDFLNMTYTPSTGVCGSCTPNAAAAPTQTVGSTVEPANGVSSKVTFKDGTYLKSESWWVSNDGITISAPRLAPPLEDPKKVLSNLNLEMRFTASEFGDRDIDIVLPGEVFTTGANGSQDVRLD